MYKLFLAGGIASGKSPVARTMQRLGAWRYDLDRVSREVLAAGSPVVARVAEAFGADLLDPQTGELNRHLLAERAFQSEETTRLLERIETPAIREALVRTLAGDECTDGVSRVCVVEVPLLDRVTDLVPLVDEVVCVVAPLELRRERAIGRGMDASDFEARRAKQPTDEFLLAHADTVFHNAGTEGELVSQVEAWWAGHEARGWEARER